LADAAFAALISGGTRVPMHRPGIKSHVLACALSAIAVFVLGGPAHAGPTRERAGCETQAKISFQDLMHEYVSVLQNVKARFEITQSDYRAAFSNKVNSCLLLVYKKTSINGENSDTSYLIDAASRTMYALYVETDGAMASCLLIPSIAETKPCKNRREFEDFVGNYLK
jgi:hypothetical protein